MSRAPIPTSFFALVVVRKGHRFLLVQEQRYGQTWSIPGGRVEPGEVLVDAAVRETFEESGIAVRLDGLLRVEHSAAAGASRVRVIFAGTPIDDRDPKQVADEESLQAQWLTLDELRKIPLRGSDLYALLEEVANGRQVFPLSMLGSELSI